MLVDKSIVEFSDAVTANAHNLFQAWRRNNPDGFFLNRQTARKYMLHHVDCSHLGDTTWEPSDYANSLTQRTKTCCVDYEALERWAAERGASVVDCHHCIEYDA